MTNRNVESGRLHRRSARRACGLGILALLAACASLAEAAIVEVDVERREDVYRVDGTFATHVGARDVWAVLTDYDRIDEFVSSMVESRVEHREGRWAMVRQQARVGAFPFRRTMNVGLEIDEDEPHRIEFNDVLAEDFRIYNGAWQLFADSSGTTVHYRLRARLRSAVPGFLGSGMVRSNVKKLLEQVRHEIERRAALLTVGRGEAVVKSEDGVGGVAPTEPEPEHSVELGDRHRAGGSMP